MKEKTGHVVLMGHNFASILGLARALGEKGYDITALRSGVDAKKRKIFRLGLTPEAHSRYIQKHILIHPENEEQTLKVLSETWEKRSREENFLIPVDDVCAMLIDRNYNDLKDYYILPNAADKQNGIISIMDKQYQKDLARAAGLPVAEGWTIEICSGQYTIPKDIRYPCYAKAQLPFSGRKKYMGKCDNQDDLEILLKKASAETDCCMIIEDYIPIDKEYCVVGVCNKKDVCIPDLIEETVMGHNKHAGVTCFGKVVPPDNYQETIDGLKRFVLSLDFQGFFTIDLLESGNKIYFCELNARIGGSGIAVIAADVDIATMYVSSLSGQNRMPSNSRCRPLSFVSERPLANDLFTGYITWKQYRQYLKMADYRFIYSTKDLKPYFVYLFYLARGLFKKFIHHS